MRNTFRLTGIAFLTAFLLAPISVSAEQAVRIATYNIKYLSINVQNQGDRLTKLRRVIELLEADVIGLQEIDDRAALELIFPPSDWHIIIDDDSGENQDVAAVVRRTLEVSGFASDLDADDQNFLFPSSADNSPFPDRRDVLRVDIRLPDGSDEFTLLVNHAKSRFGGRANTDFRRQFAATQLVRRLERDFDGRKVVYVCDCNDNPDDRSSNIFETGDPNAVAGMEETPGPFMINLTETLVAAGHVSHGRKTNELTPDGLRVDTIDAESRLRNHNARGTNQNTGDILFDQIFVSPAVLPQHEQGSTAVFNDAIGARGNDTSRASDHLPVFADFTFGGDAVSPPSPSAGVRIVGLLPNPDGQDAGNEVVTLRNSGASAVDLSGWRLRDRAGNEFHLSGTIPGDGERRIVMQEFSMPLNNSGDRISLIDQQQDLAHFVEYQGVQVIPGQEIRF